MAEQFPPEQFSIEQQKLPDELWSKVLESVDDASVFAFASTCKQLRHVQEESGRKLETNLRSYLEAPAFAWFPPHNLEVLSEAWCLWSWSLISTEDETVREAIIDVEADWGPLSCTRGEMVSESIIRAATYWGHLSALMLFAEESGKQDHSFVSDDLFCYAAEAGHLDVVIWLKSKLSASQRELWESNYFCWEQWICQIAAERGHFELVKWLKEEGSYLYEDIFRGAAAGGSMEMLQWLKDQECPWNEDVCKGAASLEILKWLLSNGCPWDRLRFCSHCAGCGKLEQLKWAREQGCPWDELTFREAADGGHLEVLAWLRAQGCPCSGRISAWNLCKVEVIRWLREHGWPWDERTTFIYKCMPKERLDVVKWAIEHGCPWNRAETRAKAARLGWNEFVEWIDEHVNSL